MTGPASRRSAAGIVRVVLCAVGVLGAASALHAQTRELIVDILTSPSRYWNRSVTLHGHIRRVTPDPPGTSRGMYLLRDSSDQDLMVYTNDLPSLGKEYTVTGRVEQATPDAMVPVLREARRSLSGADAPRPAPAPAPQPAQPAAAPPPSASVPAPAPAPAVTPAAPVAVAVPPAGGVNGLTYGLLALAGLLSIALIVAFWPRKRAAPPSSAMKLPPPPISAVSMPVPPRNPLPPAPPPAAGKPTELLAHRAAPAPEVKATEIFRDLGAELSVLDGPEKGRAFPLTKPRIAIGRAGGRANDLTLHDDTVSREHARIVHTPADGTFRLINESGTNPVLVNGQEVESALLQDGDVIRLGATSLKFVRTRQG